MTFKGKYEHTIDAKGRMFIPAKFREGLGESFVIFKWLFDNCLYLMPNEEFEHFSDTLRQLPMAQKDAATIKRVLYANATDVELDAQKRLHIPQDLRKYAKLEKDVVVVGVESHVELWDLEAWQNMTTDQETIQGAIQNLNDLGYRF